MSQFAIRRYEETDAVAFFEAIEESREHISRWMSWLKPELSLSHVQEWITECRNDFDAGIKYEYLIVDSETGQIVGACGLNSLNRFDKCCNLGYWVRASRLGEGAASGAVKLLRDLAFRELGLIRVEIVVAEGNEASQRVARSVGAVDEGIQNARLLIGDLAHDARMYSLVNPRAARVSRQNGPPP